MLREARVKRGLRQLTAADLAGVSRPTLRLLERGGGNLRSFDAALAALRLSVQGRHLPPGDTIGRRLYLLRARKGLSQRDVAKLIGVSAPSIVQVERHGVGRVRTLDRMLTVLGAGPYLAAADATKGFYTHAGNSSTANTWTTPPGLLRVLYGALGKFDLDPCSPTASSGTPPVSARVHYTAEQDGLLLPWFGSVFVNPPYSRELPRWIAKCRSEFESGNARWVAALIPARTDTAYWHAHVATTASVVFLRGRLSFGTSAQSAPFPSALVCWGIPLGLLQKLRDELTGSWLVPSSSGPG